MGLVKKEDVRKALKAARDRNFELSEPEIRAHIAQSLSLPVEAVDEVAEEREACHG
ncbi:hypothetical protein [Caldimonas tepidiphila]|uniref:hypothetical protein n=1 Tax=Caldimonas tepidiphila TaxID=2315841 RepID=UPI0013003AE6|nr:hypothetical protein [Caldimonas tepidiphila]